MMKRESDGSWLIMRALWELCRYDLAIHLFGFRRVLEGSGRVREKVEHQDSNLEDRISDAMRWASSLYWKRVLCLQRSVAMARLLRRYGLDAEVVIGCRSEPFASHAWVEIDGRIVNDSSGYQKLMSVLERI